MEIKYQSGLPHQQKAVDAVVEVFKNVYFNKPTQQEENPTFAIDDPKIKTNIRHIQNNNDIGADIIQSAATLFDNPNCLTLDIKMETGTGKTYVYTHTIYELHKRFGINKFIVAVPTLAIKEGAKAFISDPEVKRHFSDTCGYNAEIDLQVVTARQVKKGKRLFPSEIRSFVDGSHQITNKIHVLLINMALLSDSKNGMLMRDDYDITLFDGLSRPYDTLKATRPFVIIDEPHRFSRDQKAYSVISQYINPRCIIRFGATFPDISEGKGKAKVIKKDYENLLYNLNACDSFNQNLIKGVSKEHFEPTDKKHEKIRLVSIENKMSAVFSHITADKTTNYTLRKGESLGLISNDMEGLLISGIGKDVVEFSNAQQKRKGEEFNVSAYSEPYQSAMMALAVERHFETERANFNRSHKIKTLALFFIDDIQSFRGGKDDSEKPWLREAFNDILKRQLNKELDKENTQEYADFLKASLDNIDECSAGYFAQDNSDSDEAVAKEVDDILRNKKSLMSFRTSAGNWNVRRFLFSKWTLKEGWDNPNVFTITKLRSSGSEISKLQEVGRGLRLPVDEYGNRISDEEFRLNYIVDFKEADFADRLVAEINSDVLPEGKELKITDEQLEEVAIKRNIEKKKLFILLLSNDYVDTDKKIITENITAFYEDYPEFKPVAGVNTSKVTDRNKKQTSGVPIRQERYAELKDLWQKLNRKYVIFFDKELNKKIEEDFHLSDGSASALTITSERNTLGISDGKAYVAHETGVQFGIQGRQIPYNEFLKRINKATSLPINLIHSKITDYFKTHEFSPDLINESFMAQFVNQFRNWKIANELGLLHYKQANYTTEETALTNNDGSLKAEVSQGLIGTEKENGHPSDKYLYDGIFYDSQLERQNILSDVDNVVVFGKIPRSSISIPTVIGNYSPDFMYVVKRKDGKQELNIIIETKGVDNEASLRGEEKARILCAEKFFTQLQSDGFDVKFHRQLNSEQMKSIIDGLMEKE